MFTAVPDTVNVKISPPVSTVSIVIVTSFAGLNPPTCVPNTVTVSSAANPVPCAVNVALYVAPSVLIFKLAPIPALFVLNVTLVKLLAAFAPLPVTDAPVGNPLLSTDVIVTWASLSGDKPPILVPVTSITS